MAAPRLARVMLYQLKAVLAEDHPNILVVVDDSNVRRWHFLATNLPPPYVGGEYIFRLDAPESFPQKPPTFQFLTPNGVFVPGGPICISIGEFHATQARGAEGSYGWRASLGMVGFAREVVNGLVVSGALESGIRIAIASPSARARVAASSAAFNRKNHAELMADFAQFEEAHPDNAAVRLRRMWRAAAAAGGAAYDPPPAGLRELFAEGFGGDAWPVLAGSLGPLAADGGGGLLGRLAPRVREALAERDAAARLALARALHARILWEERAGGDEDAENTHFAEAFAAFLEALPGVCGSASAETVPCAMAAAAAAPGAPAFPRLHADLAGFLRAADIDAKARLGAALAARALALAEEEE